MYTFCDSTNINTIIQFVPNCLKHVSSDGFNGRSNSYFQFRDTCGTRRNIKENFENILVYNSNRMHKSEFI